MVLGSTDVPTVAAFMQGFQQQHFTPKLFIAAAGPDQGAAFIKAVGVRANAAAMMVPNGWYGGYANAESQKMVAEYVKANGGTASDVNADVAEAYSVGQVVEQAIKATGGTDNAAIIKYLHSGVTLNTVQGKVLFNSLGENSAAAGLHLPVEQVRHRVQPGPAEERPQHQGGDHRYQAGLGWLGLEPGPFHPRAAPGALTDQDGVVWRRRSCRKSSSGSSWAACTPSWRRA